MNIRSATAADAAAILAIYAPIVRDTIISFETEVPSVAEIVRRIDTTLKTHPYLVAEMGARSLAMLMRASTGRDQPTDGRSTRRSTLLRRRAARASVAHSTNAC